MIIYNDQANELAMYRLDYLNALPLVDVTDFVVDGVERVSVGMGPVMGGIDASCDGITHNLWLQAVGAAHQNGELIGYFEGAIGDQDPIWPLNEVAKLVAGRVAKAILYAHGLLD